MKRKIIFALTLSAVLLSACDPVDGRETPFTETVSDILTQSAETEADAQFTLGGETEPAVTESDYSAENISLKYFDYGSIAPADSGSMDRYGHDFFISGNILGCSYGVFAEDGSVEYQIRLYDTEENKLLKTIELPDGYMTEDCIYGAGRRCALQVQYQQYSPGGGRLCNRVPRRPYDIRRPRL